MERIVPVAMLQTFLLFSSLNLVVYVEFRRGQVGLSLEKRTLLSPGLDVGSSVYDGWHFEWFESFRARVNNKDSVGSVAGCDCATLLALPPRYCCVNEILVTLLLRFRCASSPR